jgi:hypothetical protein
MVEGIRLSTPKRFTMKYFRPLSESMVQKLKQCYQREQNGPYNKPCTIEEMTYAVAPLYKRGLIEIKKQVVENKVLHCVYVTSEGLEYLKRVGPGSGDAAGEA